MGGIRSVARSSHITGRTGGELRIRVCVCGVWRMPCMVTNLPQSGLPQSGSGVGCMVGWLGARVHSHPRAVGFRSGSSSWVAIHHTNHTTSRHCCLSNIGLYMSPSCGPTWWVHADPHPHRPKHAAGGPAPSAAPRVTTALQRPFPAGSACVESRWGGGYKSGGSLTCRLLLMTCAIPCECM